MSNHYYDFENSFCKNKRVKMVNTIKGFLAGAITFTAIVSFMALFIFLTGIVQ